MNPGAILKHQRTCAEIEQGLKDGRPTLTAPPSRFTPMPPSWANAYPARPLI